MLDTSKPGVTDVAHITADPMFRELARSRSVLAWSLSAIILVVYLGFIVVVAFLPKAMAIKIAGATLSLGIVVGLGVIVFAVLITGFYVFKANGRYDELTRALKERYAK